MELSVIIPCFHAEATIVVQLEALANQRWSKPWEVTVSDNGSTDNSMEIVKSFEHRLLNLRIVASSDRRRQSYALNVGARASTAKALVFCDADDWVAPGWVAEMTLKQLLLISVGVVLSAFGQISLKYGISNPRVQSALDSTSLSQIAWTVGTDSWVLSGIIIYIASMAIWLLGLARIDVSQAYPFVGAGFLLTLAFGYFFLGESVNPYRITGTVLVAAGIIIVSLK